MSGGRGPRTAAAETEWEVTREKAIKLGFLRSPNLRILEPIRIVIREDRGEYVASSALLGAWGCGNTEGEAINDLQLYIADSYQFLRRNERRLEPGLVKQLAAYRRKIGDRR